ncbi:MAG: hypothetical protein HYS32_01530 [Candidatus Woesearchaeota archaeon]|nr:MAG: hypothetical protein HYS32_01530 [Candidatus Woesearchaeota archaeon]
MNGKRGQKPQSAADVATLIAIIALLIIIYVLLLPPQERRDLLNITAVEDDDVSSDGKTSPKDTIIVLSEKPGEVSLDVEPENEHTLNDINLFSRSQSETLDIANTVFVKRSIFNNKLQEFSFDLNDLDLIQEVDLLFFVEKADGVLFIEINDNLIFDIEIDQGRLRTVKIPTQFLKDKNVIKISVSKPGFIFGSNSYTLSDIQIVKRFKVTNLEVIRKISLNAAEIDNLDEALIQFSLFCNDQKVRDGVLNVLVNEHNVYSDVAFCDRGLTEIEVDDKFIDEGENVISFSADKGDYLLDDPLFITKLKGGALLTFDFFLDTEEFDEVWKGKRKAKLFLIFGGEFEDVKNARFEINGDIVRVNTKEGDFTRDISGFVKEGQNIIKIVPLDDFIIELMEVRLEKP